MNAATTPDRAEQTETETVQITRPERMTDAQWHAALVDVQRLITGHEPWCEEVEISTGTLDGSTLLFFDFADGVEAEGLTLDLARSAAATLIRCADIAAGVDL